jgi:ribosomal protein L9
MYGSVTQQDVLSLIEKDFNVELEKRAAKAIQPIKKTGVYDLTIHLKEGVTAEMKIKVIPEGGTLEEETNEENTAEVTEEDTAE